MGGAFGPLKTKQFCSAPKKKITGSQRHRLCKKSAFRAKGVHTMRDDILHQEYSADGAFRFEVYHHADFFEVWVQRKITDEYMSPDWFTYYDMPNCRHCTDTLERAIAIGRDDLRALAGQSNENKT